jgi:hypothetical protein
MKMSSTANIDPTKLDLGPCRVSYNGVDIGSTLKNVVIHLKTDKPVLKADQTGSTVLNRIINGMEVTVTTEIAEVDNISNWKTAFPHGQLFTSGPNKAFRFLPQIGQDDYSIAQPLVLHPLRQDNADKSLDWTFYKAVATEESDFTFSPSEQRAIKVVWTVYPNVGVSGYPFAFQGDTAIGLVASIAGTPSFTGTGNGTITNVVAHDAKAVNETITVNCIAAASNGGIFHVSGSVSGELGLATLPGTPGGYVDFVSGPISFRITDGSSDFVVNDNWTIAMTAANYA